MAFSFRQCSSKDMARNSCRSIFSTAFQRSLYKAAVVLACAAAGLAGCSKLDLFNTLVPYDAGVRKVASDVAYGAEPRQTLDIYRPETAEKALPVIFFIYGGSWNSGRKEQYAFAAHAFAAEGYVTVVADYRLVPAVRYPAFVDDGAKALAWTYRHIAAYGGDPHRLFVAAHSAGAYNAMMLAADPRFLRRQGLSTGIVRAVAGLSGPYDFLPLDVDATRQAFRGVDDLRDTQPVNLVHRGMPPVFIACGTADTLVLPRNTRALDRRLTEAGVAHETTYYQGVGHAGTIVDIARPFRGRAPVLADMMAFFGRHGGAPAGQGSGS